MSARSILLAAACLTAVATAASAAPVQDRPVYPGGPEAECAIAADLAKSMPENKVDPVLRDKLYGDVDCTQAFALRKMAVQLYDEKKSDTAFNLLSRPRLMPNGHAAIDLYVINGNFRMGTTYELELEDSQWVIRSSDLKYIT